MIPKIYVIRKSEFVAKNQFLHATFPLTSFLKFKFNFDSSYFMRVVNIEFDLI